jgi:hypothetical protein
VDRSLSEFIVTLLNGWLDKDKDDNGSLFVVPLVSVDNVELLISVLSLILCRDNVDCLFISCLTLRRREFCR